MQKVKIIKCSKDILWYKEKVGNIYKVQFIDDNGDIVVDLENESGQLGSVLPSDIDIVKEEEIE